MSGYSRMIFRLELEPELRVEVVVHVLDPEIAGDPRTVDDQRHRNLVELFEAGGPLERVPLFGSHEPSFVVTPRREMRPRVKAVQIVRAPECGGRRLPVSYCLRLEQASPAKRTTKPPRVRERYTRDALAPPWWRWLALSKEGGWHLSGEGAWHLVVQPLEFQSVRRRRPRRSLSGDTRAPGRWARSRSPRRCSARGPRATCSAGRRTPAWDGSPPPSAARSS